MFCELQMCMLYSMLYLCTACIHALMINSDLGHLVDNSHSDEMKLFGARQSPLYELHILHVDNVFFITYNLEISRWWSV